jgi:hypothetical protein
MRAAILVAGCFLISSALAADQQVSNAAQSTAAKPVVVALVAQKTPQRPAQSVKTDVPVRVWTLEMACCEAQ